VTFAHLKPVHVLYPGRAACGAIEVVDIGVEPAGAGMEGAPTFELATESAMASLLPRRNLWAHKGESGRLLVVGGSVGLTGAVVLASTAALRVGAGLVTAGVPESVNDAIESAMIEPMTWPLPETPERALAASAARMVLTRAVQVSAVALGPGLSRSTDATELAQRVIAECPVPIVLDADGLNAFAGHADLFAKRHGGPLGHEPARGRRSGPAELVLTPHLGELSRLTGRSAEDLERDRLSAPCTLAREWNAVVVMKGAPTVTASPDGRATVNSTGNPGMATAGMGDVLTGIIAGFLAQGLAAYDAARLGVFVHGLAADFAHARVGTLALVAGDVTATLPQAIHRLELAGSRSFPKPLPKTRMAPAPPDPLRST
jgi:NAD(P)H-hydrate epimerase